MRFAYVHARSTLVVGLQASFLSLALTPSGAQSYDIIDLGAQTSATAINQSGQVTGARTFAGQGQRAYLWSPANPTVFANLGTVKGYTSTWGSAISGNGDVAGSAGGGNSIPHAILWAFGKTGEAVGSTKGTDQTEATGVNNSKDVVGWFPGKGAFLSKLVNTKRQLYIIGQGTARGINSSGIVIGDKTGALDGYVWTPTGSAGTGVTTALPSGFAAYAIADDGTLAGRRTYTLTAPDGTTGDNDRPAACLAPAGFGNSAYWMDVPWPPAPGQGQWVLGRVVAMNGSNTLIGYAEALDLSAPGYPLTARSAWIWDGVSGTRDLATLIPPGSGWTIDDVKGINDSGWVVGNGKLNGVAHAFLLKPR